MVGTTDTVGEMELVALETLAEAEEPIGSARLMDAFRRAGIAVAEATAGRYLRQLDERGHTRSINTTKGRVITAAGEGRLRELRVLRRQGRHGARLLGALNATELDDLIDLLRVRRAVEVEAARLAATRASDDELARLEAFADEHVHEASTSHEIAEPSMSFHRMVAEASHNRMLIAVGLLLLDPANDPLEKVLEAIALDAGATLDHVSDHLRVAAALRARDAAAAEATMRAHLDKLIQTVETYRDHAKLTPSRV